MFRPAEPERPPLDPNAMRISVEPEYMADQSDPETDQYVFAYRVVIENVGVDPARLFWRHWYIHDPVAGDQVVHQQE